MKVSHWHLPDRQKKCAICGDIKPLAEFSAYKYITMQGKQSTRYESRCKPCNRTRRRERYAVPEFRDIDLKTSKKWKDENRLHLAEYQKQKQQTQEYRDLKAVCQRRRKARMRAGTDQEDSVEIKNIYKEAKRLEKETGIKHHVDHIIPLKLGGKHAASNLQVLTAIENLKKGASLTRLAITGDKDA